MARLYDAGRIAGPGEDASATTGPHLDFRVTDEKGNPVNPNFTRSFLGSRLLVGKNRTPLWQQKGADWVSSFPITSGYGPRTAPTEGASTFHPALDFGIGAGEPLAWLANPGDVYTPNKGYGEIKTTDAQGRPYTVKLLHTKPGAAANTGAVQTPQQAVAPSGNVYNFHFGSSIGKDGQSSISVQDLLNKYVEQLSGTRKTFDPISLVNSALNPQTIYFT